MLVRSPYPVGLHPPREDVGLRLGRQGEAVGGRREPARLNSCVASNLDLTVDLLTALSGSPAGHRSSPSVTRNAFRELECGN